MVRGVLVIVRCRMRTFIRIFSWVAWLFCAYYLLGVWFIPIMNATPPPLHTARRFSDYWAGLFLFTLVALFTYLLRHRFWFVRWQTPRLGFLELTALFYLSVVFVTAAGFVPYFMGDRSIIQWANCILGTALVMLGIPRVPPNSAAASTDPPRFRWEIAGAVAGPSWV